MYNFRCAICPVLFFFFQSQALVFVKCDITGGHPGLDPNLAGLVAVVVAALV